MRADVLIQNGRILDGTGAPDREGDVAILDGKVLALGTFEGDASEIIDAEGKIVAPGFVDIHSHGDLVLAWPSESRLSLLEGRIAQGITTEVIGNCGLGAAPLFGHGPELIPQIHGWMTPASYEFSWTDLASYFEHLEDIGLPVNVGSLVAHGTLRLGAHHLARGETDRTTRDRMGSVLDEALEQGALGLSAGLIYPPGMYTSTDELTVLARRLAKRGGVFTCHIRGSSETLLDAVDEILQIGREAGVPVHHSHAEAVGQAHWSKLSHFLEAEQRARRDGVEVTADMFPYDVAATMMLAIYPPWSLEGGLPQLLERLKDPAVRARIGSDIETVVPEWPPWQENGWPHNLVRAVGWDGIRISTVASSRNRDVEGSSLAELGEKRGQHPFEAISDLMIEEDGNVGQFVLDITGEAGLRELVAQPEIAFITDANDYGKGKPHPAAYGSFPRVLGRFAREEGVLSLAEAVRRMTSLPADILGLDGRGRLAPEHFADVVIFDPSEIGDEATLAEPRKKAKGIERVLVNGVTVYRDGALTGTLPGTTLSN